MFPSRSLGLAVTIAAFQLFCATASGQTASGVTAAAPAESPPAPASAPPRAAVQRPKGMPPPTPFVVRTADGLPMEVEFVSCFKGEVRLRNTTSGREIPMILNRLDKNSQKAVADEILKIQQTVTQPLSFGYGLENNGSSTAREFTIRKDLILEVRDSGARGGNNDSGARGGNNGSGGTNAARTVPGFGYCVRFKAALPPNFPVELPIDLKIIWGRSTNATPPTSASSGKRSSSGGGASRSQLPPSAGGDNSKDESVRLVLGATPGEYLSKPIAKPARAVAVALVAINPANNVVLWKGGDGNLSREFLAANAALTPGK